MVGDGKIAARLKGTEERVSCTDRECPICFFNYSEINVTKCCQANICTECYLQVRPQKSGTKNKSGKSNHNCPFCNASKLHVTVAGKLDASDVEKRFQEEQALEAAKIRARSGSSTPPPFSEQPQGSSSVPSTPTSGFGSSLAMNERVAMMRMRSSSLSENTDSAKSPVQEITSLAMTPEERRSLEQEMRAQHHHPLTMRLEAEESERRMRNQMEYYRRSHERNGATASSSSSRMYAGRPPQQFGTRSLRTQGGAREGRDWNRIVDAFERRGSGNVQSLDDLVVLEAAIMLSMEEEARRRGEAPSSSRGAAASSQLDAERHASANFPLARERVSESRFSMPSSSFPSSSSNPISNVLSGRANGSGRLSEEQQIAMAIRASLQESGGDREQQVPSDPPSR